MKVQENRGVGTAVKWNTSSGHADDVNLLSKSMNTIKESKGIIFPLSLSLSLSLSLCSFTALRILTAFSVS
jgi:hypothetical protein